MTKPSSRPKRCQKRYKHLLPGYEKCYECGGDGACSVCGGEGTVDRRLCTNCNGDGYCILCRGAGQLAPAKTVLEYVGAFRELDLIDDPDAPSIADFRGRRPAAHKQEVVAYLLAGKPMAVSPGGMAVDVFDPGRKSTTRSILTDGKFAWSRELAYYVEHYDVELPPHFELHMATHAFRIPDVDTNKLVLP